MPNVQRNSRRTRARSAKPRHLLTAGLSRLGRASTSIEQFLNREANVTGDLAKEGWRDVSACMKRDRSFAAVGMPVLTMGSTLANLDKSEPQQQGSHLARLEDRQ